MYRVWNFYSHAPRGARRGTGQSRDHDTIFLLTRPSRGATGNLRQSAAKCGISTHTPLAGRDSVNPMWSTPLGISTHTPLAGRDPELSMGRRRKLVFLLTRPSRGATRSWIGLGGYWTISTHTPLAGRDAFDFWKNRGQNISTHTPLAGRDSSGKPKGFIIVISTHTPLAGRDPVGCPAYLHRRYFYSHAPRGARPVGASVLMKAV